MTATDHDRRKVVTDAVFEAMADARVMRRLQSSRAYRNAASAEQQAQVEARIEREVIADLERDYRVGDPAELAVRP